MFKTIFNTYTVIFSLREGPFCRGKMGENRSGAPMPPKPPRPGKPQTPKRECFILFICLIFVDFCGNMRMQVIEYLFFHVG